MCNTTDHIGNVRIRKESKNCRNNNFYAICCPFFILFVSFFLDATSMVRRCFIDKQNIYDKNNLINEMIINPESRPPVLLHGTSATCI